MIFLHFVSKKIISNPAENLLPNENDQPNLNKIISLRLWPSNEVINLSVNLNDTVASVKKLILKKHPFELVSNFDIFDKLLEGRYLKGR